MYEGVELRGKEKVGMIKEMEKERRKDKIRVLNNGACKIECKGKGSKEEGRINREGSEEEEEEEVRKRK